MQVTVVTLIVTPDQAERLTLASTEGKIQLALRNPLDLESPETAGRQARDAHGKHSTETGSGGTSRDVAGSTPPRRSTPSRHPLSKSSAATSGSTSPSDRS